MIIGIAKILILFPFLPYLIFMITSKNRKLAHVYCGPIVFVCNVILLNYLFKLMLVPVVLIGYLITVFYFTSEKTKKKRTPKRFWMNFSYFTSWLGFRLYVILVIIGTILEMLK